MFPDKKQDANRAELSCDWAYESTPHREKNLADGIPMDLKIDWHQNLSDVKQSDAHTTLMLLCSNWSFDGL